MVTPHILVIRLSAMGDVAMTIPVLRALVQKYPNTKITVVSRSFFKPMFDTIPNLNFFSVDVKQKHSGFLGILRLFQDLKKLNFTHIADLHNVLRSKILRNLFALNGIQVAATDKGRAEKKALTRAENKIFQPLKTMFERHAETFNALGFPIDLVNPIFPKPAILSQEINDLILNRKESKLIGIAPFAQYESKVYPKDLMQKVIDTFASNQGNTVLLFGSNQEIIDLQNFKKDYTNVIVIAGELSFTHELDVISNLDVMLSMDSGNAHIAAIFGVPVVTLWGATHPFAGFLPFNQPLENALVSDRAKYPKLPTSVYGNKQVADYEDVMRTIKPEIVVQKVEEIIS